MRIVLLGSPGAGKGTQAEFIAKHYHIPHISTGDMLRTAIREESPLGLQLKTVIAEGKLVSDDIIIALVEQRIYQIDCQDGFLLDGVPRTVEQAQALREKHIFINFVIEILVSDEEIVKRLTGRRIHPRSGRIYHVLYNPPKKFGLDDVTEEVLIQRDDDKEKTVRKRLEIYHRLTKPLLSYYRHWQDADPGHAPVYIQVNGQQDVQQVKDQIFLVLQRYRLAE